MTSFDEKILLLWSNLNFFFSDSVKKLLGSGSGFKVFWIRIRIEIFGWIRIQLNSDPKHCCKPWWKTHVLVSNVLDYLVPESVWNCRPQSMQSMDGLPPGPCCTRLCSLMAEYLLNWLEQHTQYTPIYRNWFFTTIKLTLRSTTCVYQGSIF